MTIDFRPGQPQDETALRLLWAEAFSESPEFVDLFFAAAYAHHRCRLAVENGQLRSVLYWFDCELSGERIAYLYGIATFPAHQGRGIAGALIRDTHRHLAELGYTAALLVPGSKELFRFYQHLGYETAASIAESTAEAGIPIPIREVTPDEYCRLRRALLPQNGVVQEGENLKLLQNLAKLYAGDGFLAAISREPSPQCLELLGDPCTAPGLLAALNIPRANFRTLGSTRPFAMAYWLTEAARKDSIYFGFAFD